MLHELNSLIGTPVIASDGETGKIRDFLFDDQSWQVGYVVAETGNWLKRRDVVLPIEAFEQPDWVNKTCRVCLSKKQVRDSPDVDTEKPVFRQQENAMREYFGSLAYWVDSQYGLSAIPAGVGYRIAGNEDPHLRSTSHLLGYTVWATDGEMGRVEGLVLDDASWHLGYLDLKAGSWLRDRSVLVPTRWVQAFIWAEFRIYLHHSRTGD
ncbi:MAG: PRC-barrel domain-containing protein [Terracidiphilus sp.]